MPELPEVETVRRLLERTLGGQVIARCDAEGDEIVFGRQTPAEVREAITGKTVLSAGRKGKLFWLQLDGVALMMHLGMSGWVRALDSDLNTRLLSHGSASLDDESGRPRFLKLMLTADNGTRIAFTDGRRLARIWLGEVGSMDSKVQELGPDAYNDLPDAAAFTALYGRRKPAIKTLLLDQSILSGIGNWVADEVLFHARIDPRRQGLDLGELEFERLRASIEYVLQTAVSLSADHLRYPADWLFVHRWGGSKGSDRIGGHAIVREPIGGRTTAWVPSLQQ